ncbi:glycoside hydrolase family 24 protein [Burkholderia sp. TSV86]|uniref:glycoside hydrolase family 24 protein n=1 Tax=Burkholderia sp. TSV86 TaxID=1385594 RepID=UPI0009E6F3F2|nr:glycoside hydrolase family 104 protein [Burkholderia sp. TSV86]
MRNRKAFLDMLAVSEGTNISPAARNDGYDVIVARIDGVPEILTDCSTHPFGRGRASKRINNRGLESNASGHYQFMLKDWSYYRKLLNLPDFGPASQDSWAIQLIKEHNALSLIDAGNFDLAVYRVGNLWASLPGAGYGQLENSLVALRQVYLQKGGEIF